MTPQIYLPLIAVLLAFCSLTLLALVLMRLAALKTGNADNLRKMEETRLDEERIERGLREEMGAFREELDKRERLARAELNKSVGELSEKLGKHLTGLASGQKDQLDSFAKQLSLLTEANEKRFESLRSTVRERLELMQQENAKKLDQMRNTVDEKLQGTLEKRLGESFKQVSERLEQVHRGLGEMHNLANGVGDLKRVLTNVKTRGTWGEIQLGALLAEILTEEQYERNVATRPGKNSRVEFALRLPGPDDDKTVWLPIDAKFPQEDYQRLQEAQEAADPEAVEKAAKELEKAVQKMAREVREKYVEPPYTTDFALLYLPTEGLYAEVIRRPGLIESLQRQERVVVAGPTTLTALLNSLQVGFRTLAIQKRSSEVWNLLSRVKNEFAKFSDILQRVRKNLETATNTIDRASSKSRTIERRLRDVQGLPEQSASPEKMLNLEEEEINEDE
ncbi:MAG: DNA recombination protein RmuC [Candidatus Sumerlaeota bacterium]